ncbi:MAG TPA: subclass B3 metallo-beta-lactamase [Pyrinomonadaceae bacterium]|nr:subclass B3 metallo-beta-lactamase [Pyrinomonadaceae bacterium]
MTIRRTSLSQFVLISLCLLLCSVSTYSQPDEQSRSWNQPVKPYRIIGNVYYVGATEVSSFLITTPNGHILLDSGFYETVPQIRKNVAELGFRFADIKILINSHAHYDHAGGLALLKQLTHATFIASRGDADLLARGGKNDFGFGDRFPYQPVTADKTIDDGYKIKLGGTELTAYLTPGHTKGCITWTMKVKEGSKEYDVVFVGSSSVPGYKLVGNEQYPTIIQDYERTFRVLKSLRCDVFLAAHGSFYFMLQKLKLLEEGSKTNPFIDPTGYRAYIERSEKAFRDQVNRESK